LGHRHRHIPGIADLAELAESHEDDQIFIEASGDRMAKEQRDLVQKINTLSRPIMASGVAAGGLLLFIAGFWLYQGLKNF
jgi:hypothetical protein